MLSFATEFPIDHARSSADFLTAIQTWILGSPHTRFTKEDFSSLFVTDESCVQKDNENINALWCSTDDEDSAGIKYVRHDTGLEWVTTVVFSRSGVEGSVSDRVGNTTSFPGMAALSQPQDLA